MLLITTEACIPVLKLRLTVFLCCWWCLHECYIWYVNQTCGKLLSSVTRITTTLRYFRYFAHMQVSLGYWGLWLDLAYKSWQHLTANCMMSEATISLIVAIFWCYLVNDLINPIELWPTNARRSFVSQNILPIAGPVASILTQSFFPLYLCKVVMHRSENSGRYRC